jgi:excisionase family DNA binding protein
MKQKNSELSVPAVARQLGCSLKWIYDLIYCGKMSATKVAGRWRIPAGAVAERLKRRGQQQ